MRDGPDAAVASVAAVPANKLSSVPAVVVEGHDDGLRHRRRQ